MIDRAGGVDAVTGGLSQDVAANCKEPEMDPTTVGNALVFVPVTPSVGGRDVSLFIDTLESDIQSLHKCRRRVVRRKGRGTMHTCGIKPSAEC